MKEIIPALLSNDIKEIKDNLAKLEGLVDWAQIDIMDNKWITGWFSGLTRYNSTNYQHYTTENSGLPHNNTTAVVIDNMNNKWIGTEIGLVVFNEDGIVSVEHIYDLLPSHFALKQNYPNPFNSTTTINYILQNSDKISLKIFNLVGQEIETLINGYQIAGGYKIKWKPEGLSSGIYFCRLQTSKFLETKKLILQN